MLNRMQHIVAFKMFDSENLAAVQHRQKQDAGIYRAIDQLALFDLANHNRAGTAIALIAAFFRALALLIQPQPIEQAQGWRTGRNLNIVRPKIKP